MRTPAKLDLHKLHQADYVAPKKPVLLRLKPARYLAISGQGAPGGDAFVAGLGALYGVAFTIKMTRKFAGQGDYTVGKLEALWFFAGDPAQIPPAQWRWQLLIRTPDFVKPADLRSAVAKLRERGKEGEAASVKLVTLDEGQCVQMLHVGPYDREGETIETMGVFARKKGFQLAGPHHEIYVSDPRRVPPERLKTILREPLKPAA